MIFPFLWGHQTLSVRPSVSSRSSQSACTCKYTLSNIYDVSFIILLPSSVLSVIWITEGETPFSQVTLEPTLENITEIGHDNRHLLESSIIFVRLTLTSLSPIQYNEDERDLEAFSPFLYHYPIISRVSMILLMQTHALGRCWNDRVADRLSHSQMRGVLSFFWKCLVKMLLMQFKTVTFQMLWGIRHNRQGLTGPGACK